MKKIIVVITLIFFSINSFSQTCEEREAKMLTIIGGFSAGMMYNTYGLIGAVSDGFIKDAYTTETVTQLMTAQKGMTDNFIVLMEDNLKGNIFNQQNDKDLYSIRH